MGYADIAASKPRNVLIIDDDDDDVFLLTRAFNIASAQSNIVVNVTRCPNGLEALGAVARGDLKSELFDLLIVDLNMPVLDGLKFLRALRGEFGFDNVQPSSSRPPTRLRFTRSRATPAPITSS